MTDLAKILIATGLLVALSGVVLLLAGKLPGIGKLPGDILIKKENFTFYFPLTTSILLSIVVSLILYFFTSRR